MTKTKNAIPEQRNPLIEGPDLASWEEELLSGANSKEAEEAFKHRPAHEQLGVMTVQLDVAVKDERREAYARGDRAQDHGTVGTRKGHGIGEDEYDWRGFVADDKRMLREARLELDEYLDSLTPAQLEAEADKILGEEAIDTSDGSYEELPADLIINSDEAVVDGEDESAEYRSDEVDIDLLLHNEQATIAGGEEILTGLRAIKNNKRSRDNYESVSGEDDRIDLVLNGMHVIKGHKGQ